jgi:HD-GYP domain-containing protein (c-di-GMP phosphodiesterase class II)
VDKLRVSRLRTERKLPRPLFHSSGEVLLDAGSPLRPTELRLLIEAGIEEVFQPAPDEDSGGFVHQARNRVFSVDELDVGHRATQAIFNRVGTLLIEAGAEITERVAEGLRRRGIMSIYVRRDGEELNLGQVQAFRQAWRDARGARPARIDARIDAARTIKAADCTAKRIDALLDAGRMPDLPRTEDPLAAKLKEHHPLEPRAAAAKDGYQCMYEDAVAQTSGIFAALSGNSDVDGEQFGELARELVGGLVEDRSLLLNLPNFRTDYSYLQGHSLGVTVLAIAVATNRGHDRHLVLEMGYAALLHDVGMLRVPPEIVNKPGNLTPVERLQIQRHPGSSLDMLQQMVGRRTGLASTIPIVAYQSHERENGSGYPKGRRGRVIHEFAKILAVCDVYQSMISPRPWRQALLPYGAMEQVVLMGSRGEVDPGIVRILLGYVSLFPIGSWVELEDGSRGRVVAASGQEYTRPVVSVMFRGALPVFPPERVNLAEQRDLSVVRPIPPPVDDLDLMDGF